MSEALKNLDQIRNEVRPQFLERLSKDERFVVPAEGDPRLAGEFYEKQQRLTLRNYGIIDPQSVEEYIANGGYYALEKALFQMTPQEILDVITDANLRGRGGAGFPAGIKWATAARENTDQKYVICNADEGDPGAYMDRSILEGDPHVVIEGMAICARAIGASKGYVYVRAEYPKAVKMLQHAIEVAKENNLLGDNIMGSDFSFDLQIRLGAGAFVCGEGTAMIQSIEGKRGMPQAKVYRTTVRGLFDKPTVVNNVETLANVAHIIIHGSEWFRSIGTEDSPGTKVFALVGKVKNAGLVEVPMGMSIREIVYDIGGGIIDDREVKAVQTGGPSGGCIPPKYFDTPVDFGSLEAIGSIMGSGGLVVMDETDCMVDIAKFFMKFTVDESCGKCTPCRIGNKRVLEILERITSGQGKKEDIEHLKELCWVISDTSLCGLGKSATNPVQSSLDYFMDEYLEHIEDKHCRAKACHDLMEYKVTDRCIGCGLCKRECPVDAIDGERKAMHHINTEICIKCGNCLTRCPVGAIILD